MYKLCSVGHVPLTEVILGHWGTLSSDFNVCDAAFGWNRDEVCRVVAGGAGLVEGQGRQPLQAVREGVFHLKTKGQSSNQHKEMEFDKFHCQKTHTWLKLTLEIIGGLLICFSTSFLHWLYLSVQNYLVSCSAELLWLYLCVSLSPASL